MADMLPSFDRPPIAEMVLAIQFPALPKLSTAWLGAFATQLGATYPVLVDVPAVGPISEPGFDDALGFEIQPLMRVATRMPTRFQARTKAGDRMVQVENGWVVLNWMRRSALDEYPRYRTLRPELEAIAKKLFDFVKASGSEGPAPNLWEVTYSNEIGVSALGSVAAEVEARLPGIVPLGVRVTAGRLRGVASSLTFEVDPGPAALTISVQEAKRIDRVHPRSEGTFGLVQFVARGRVATNDLHGALQGLDLGHAAIVKAFASLSSESARQEWGLQS